MLKLGQSQTNQHCWSHYKSIIYLGKHGIISHNILSVTQSDIIIPLLKMRIQVHVYLVIWPLLNTDIWVWLALKQLRIKQSSAHCLTGKAILTNSVCYSDSSKKMWGSLVLPQIPLKWLRIPQGALGEVRKIVFWATMRTPPCLPASLVFLFCVVTAGHLTLVPFYSSPIQVALSQLLCVFILQIFQ